MDYNTQRNKLVLPEYGRCIQEMVEYAKHLKTKRERQACAETIINLMANMHEEQSNPEDFWTKLWNHLATIANYELDIDYPVEITREDERHTQIDNIPYPQKRISQRHYGALVEEMTRKLQEMEEGPERDALARMTANQMKRDLANWNKNALSDEKILDDLAAFTHGKVLYYPEEINLLSDGDILNDVQQIQASAKKKKKK